MEETNQALDESIAEHKNINQATTAVVPATPTSRQPVYRSGLTSALRDKLTIDLGKKRIHWTKSPSGRRLNLSQSSTGSSLTDLTSSLIEEPEPENEFNYSETQKRTQSGPNSLNNNSDTNSTNTTNREASLLNDSEIKQESETRRDPQGELMEDKPHSSEGTESATRRDPKGPEGELMEDEPDSFKKEEQALGRTRKGN